MTGEVRYFDPAERATRASKYPPAIRPSLAPWAQTLDRLVSKFDLDFYPEGALRAALDRFEGDHGHAADAHDEDDSVEVFLLAIEIGGWVA